MKKLAIILLLSTCFLKAFTQEDLVEGMTPLQFRTTVNSNFAQTMDSINSLRAASNQNYGFISSHSDSIAILRGIIDAYEDSIAVLRSLAESGGGSGDFSFSDTIDLLATRNYVDSEISAIESGSGDISWPDTTNIIATKYDLDTTYEAITSSAQEAGSMIYKDSTDYIKLTDVRQLMVYGSGIGLPGDTTLIDDDLNGYGILENTEDSIVPVELKIDVSAGDSINAYLVSGTTLWVPLDTISIIHAGAGRTVITTFNRTAVEEDRPMWIEMGPVVPGRKAVKWRAILFGFFKLD